MPRGYNKILPNPLSAFRQPPKEEGQRVETLDKGSEKSYLNFISEVTFHG
jgi:hypothetical protein